MMGPGPINVRSQLTKVTEVANFSLRQNNMYSTPDLSFNYPTNTMMPFGVKSFVYDIFITLRLDSFLFKFSQNLIKQFFNPEINYFERGFYSPYSYRDILGYEISHVYV